MPTPRRLRPRPSRLTGPRRPAGRSLAQRADLVSLLARATTLAALLPALHHRLLDASGGSSSLLFESNPRSGLLESTSGYGVDHLFDGAWQAAPSEQAVIDLAFAQGRPTLVTDAERALPELARTLAAAAVVLIPLQRDHQRLGLLAVGHPGRSAPRTALSPGVADIADAFICGLELFRLRGREELQHDLRDLMDDVGQTIQASLNLQSGLDVFCARACRLFAASRAAVWLFDRRARRLVVRASSDATALPPGMSVELDDDTWPTPAMRQPRALLQPEADDAVTSVVTAPLKGCRRALGVVVFDGVRVETGRELDTLDRAEEAGRQLANTIENLQLIEDVVQSRRELENAFNALTYLVVILDRHDRVTYVNEAFASRLNRPRASFLDRPAHEYVGREIGAWLTARRDAPGTAPHRAATRDVVDPVLGGTFMVTITDMTDGRGRRTGSVLVARDLTPHAQLEADREQLRQQLAHAQKLAALGQFVAGVAHELNNPLQGVLGHVELLRAKGAFPRTARREVQTIVREATRAAGIVRNLLVFGGSRSHVRRPVSVAAILQKVVALRRQACDSRGIEVVRDYERRIPRVLGDPLLLHQVFLNLMMNAEQAVTAADGQRRITLVTRFDSQRDRVRVSVRDTGGGIPDDVLPRMFEPFYTTKAVGEGSGLGLAVAYGIVQDHGGRISASNRDDGGAELTVDLPARTARAFA